MIKQIGLLILSAPIYILFGCVMLISLPIAIPLLAFYHLNKDEL